jgi:hypothetical protein
MVDHIETPVLIVGVGVGPARPSSGGWQPARLAEFVNPPATR